jgi:hypothetical protein
MRAGLAEAAVATGGCELGGRRSARTVGARLEAQETEEIGGGQGGDRDRDRRRGAGAKQRRRRRAAVQAGVVVVMARRGAFELVALVRVMRRHHGVPVAAALMRRVVVGGEARLGEKPQAGMAGVLRMLPAVDAVDVERGAGDGGKAKRGQTQ